MAGSDLEAGLGELSAGFGMAEGFSSAFRDELARLREEMRAADRDARGLSRSLGYGLRSAFEGMVFEGARASEVLRGLGRSLASTVFSAAFRPVQEAIGAGVSRLVGGGLSGLFGGVLPFAAGGVIGAGRVRAFAAGGIVDGPTWFPMRGGVGLMGEAGPEAVMPLQRGADGRLGVRGGGGGPVYVAMQVTSPDVEGFRRSSAQIAANLVRALRRGQRNL